MAKTPSTAEYFSINLQGKSKKVLALYAKIDDALQEATNTVNTVGPELVKQLVADGVLDVPPGKEARVIRNRFGGGLQLVIDTPRKGGGSKSI